MGSSSQHYRGTARAFTEDWENVTEYAGVTASSYWKRDHPQHHRDWSSMVAELRWTWELHVYVTASLFSVLAVLCLVTVLRLRSQLSHSKNLTSINVFLGLLATSRLLVLYLDPYGSKLILPAVMLQVLWDLGYPCLVSAFCLLQLAVVRAEGDKHAKVTRLTESTASIVITFHFCLIITSGVLGAVQNWLRIVWIVTQVVFIVWGGFLFLSTLLGCLRTLRSIVNKIPVRLLAQVDPGCEVNSIVPLGMFTEEPLEQTSERPQQQQNHHSHHHHNPKSDHPHQHHPRIHITDVDEQTYSIASNVSLAAQQHQLHRSESMPMRSPPALSPTHPMPPEEQKKRMKMKAPSIASPNEDPASIKPLIVSSLPEIHVLQSCQDRPRRYTLADQKGRNQARGPATIFGFEPRSPKQSLSPSLMPSILAEDIKNETRHRSRFEKNLRHLVFTSCLGIALCLLRAYDVFGLDGLMACGNTGPVLQWFFFQTVSRFVELFMAFCLVCGSQRCMSSRYYYYRN